MWPRSQMRRTTAVAWRRRCSSWPGRIGPASQLMSPTFLRRMAATSALLRYGLWPLPDASNAHLYARMVLNGAFAQQRTCNVNSVPGRSCDGPSCAAQVWTYRSRVAVVLSVTHKGQPIQDATKLQRLQQMLFDMMDQKHQGIVTIKTVRKRDFLYRLGEAHTTA